jgi:hypothetical protein
MTGLDFVHSLLALFVCGAAYSWGISRWPEEERRVGMLCWYAHAFGAFAIIGVFTFYYGWGDMLHYFHRGRGLAAYVEYDLVHHFPQMIDLLLQRDVSIPVRINGAGESTGSMIAVGGLISMVTSSPWAGSVFVSTLSAAGQACMWTGLRELVPPERHKQAMWSVLMVPSVVFWSSSLLKETFALIGIGVVILAAGQIRRGKALQGGVLVVIGIYVIGLFKSYVLFPLALAAGIYGYWSRSASRGGVTLRPIQLLGGAVATVALVSLLGALFPKYSVENVSESIEDQQTASLSTHGGSDFRSADPDVDEGPPGAAGLAAEAPYTIMTALLRPFFFEARSAMMLINSLETSLILYFVIMAFVKTGRVELLRWLWRSPDIIASVAFVLLFSFAVGLATTNLGTLSRYRLPMMPFYFYVVFAANALPALARQAREQRAASARNTTAEVLAKGA